MVTGLLTPLSNCGKIHTIELSEGGWIALKENHKTGQMLLKFSVQKKAIWRNAYLKDIFLANVKMMRGIGAQMFSSLDM